jgi:type VI secretion system protein ImpI
MPLCLRIENETRLPDGGPLSVTVTGKRGIDIGRDTHLDWTLPDPTRYISGKHCEVRYKDGAYWLYDVSSNGTFLDGQDGRLKGPHKLRNGDRLVIGQYIILVTLDGEEAGAQPTTSTRIAEPAAYQDLWNPTEQAAPPVDRSLVRAPREQPAPVRPDFLDWAVDVPERFGAVPIREVPPPPPPDEDTSWAKGPARPTPLVESPPPMPQPRRPVWVAAEPSGPWSVQSTPQSEMATTSDAAFDQAPPHEPSQQVETPAGGRQVRTTGPAEAGDFVRLVAQGANVSEQIFAQQKETELAHQLGALMRLVVENVQQLLNARLQTKRLARSSSQTTIQALDNNPLKFSPTTEEALRIMFGPPTRSYLDASRALQQSFDDLKSHQMKTYTAMQQALDMMVEDLDPQKIALDSGGDRGLAGMVGSRKARLWDAYVARWQAKARRHDGGMVDVFMEYFAECYDRAGSKKR